MLAARVNRIYSSQRTAAPAKPDGCLHLQCAPVSRAAGASRGVEHVRRASESGGEPTANRVVGRVILRPSHTIHRLPLLKGLVPPFLPPLLVVLLQLHTCARSLSFSALDTDIAIVAQDPVAASHLIYTHTTCPLLLALSQRARVQARRIAIHSRYRGPRSSSTSTICCRRAKSQRCSGL